MVLLYLGIFVLITILAQAPVDVLNVGFDNGLNLMNIYIKWIATWDNFILKNIPFNGVMLGLSYK